MVLQRGNDAYDASFNSGWSWKRSMVHVMVVLCCRRSSAVAHIYFWRGGERNRGRANLLLRHASKIPCGILAGDIKTSKSCKYLFSTACRARSIINHPEIILATCVMVW